MAIEQPAVVAVQVHTAAEAIAEHLAGGAFAAPRPLAVAEGFEAVLPHVPEPIAVDIALVEIGTDRRAARNGAVDADRGDGNARGALVEMVAHLGFIPAEEAFAGIADVDAPLTAGLPDKLQHRTELFVGRAQRRVVLGTAHGEDREEPPVFQALGGLYFVNQMLQTKGIDIKGKTVAISGFGNVAWGAATKATELGAKVVTISGPDGYIYDPNGISGEKIDYMLELRSSGNDIVAPYADEFPGSTFVAGKRPWEVKADIALPCATQNELNGEDAQHLIDNKVTCVGEISNMGCTPEAIDLFIDNKIMYAPGKAVNAGGVATSGLEMSQNAMHLSWSAAEVDEKLHAIMHGIHAQCVKYGTEPDGYINYVKGANIAGFMKVAHAMMGQGII